jgi:membrane protein
MQDMRKYFHDIQILAQFIVARFVQDRCAQTAASLTFTTLLALVPMITIALTVFSAFPVFEDFSAQIKIYLLNNLMPENAGIIITQYMQQFADSAARLTAVGIVILTVTAMMMLLTIDKAFNVIWQVTRPRPLVKRLVAYWAVLTLAPLLIGASLSLTSWLVGLSMGHAKYVSPFGVVILKVLPVLFATMAFALLFRVVPNRHVPKLHALIGAFMAAVVFEAMSRVFGYYISHFPTYTLVYGAFASVPIFLMWIYLSWLTILFGAVIAASLSHWRTPAAQHFAPAARLLDALRVLQIMAKGFQQGRVSTLPELSKTLLLGYDTLENILDDLAGADMVRKAEGDGWLLMRDMNHIRAAELLHMFVLDRGSLPAKHNDDPLQQWLAACSDQLEQSTDITLQELFARQAA